MNRLAQAIRQFPATSGKPLPNRMCAMKFFTKKPPAPPSSSDKKPKAGQSPCGTNSTKAQSPCGANPTKAPSPCDTNPTKAQSPGGKEPTKAKSPCDTKPTKIQSPCGKEPTKAQSPCDTNPTKAQSPCGANPTKAPSPCDTNPTKALSPCGKEPTKAQSPCDTKPTKAQSPCGTRPKNECCRAPTIGINGFGRIGKCLLRLAIKKNIKVVAINQPFVDSKAIAHSFSQDTVHGPFPATVRPCDHSICIGSDPIRVFHEEKPENIKWSDVPVDYVIESTGRFLSVEAASKHISAGAKKVIITAPSKDAPMFVKGVNFDCYKNSMAVVSNASCTTNCAAPLVHIMNKKFGVVNCLLTTTHAMTATQHVHDGLNYRSAVGNIVPSSTGAAIAVGMVIPELKGKVHGDAARVPVLDVSLLKLYMNLKNPATVDDIKCEIKKQAECTSKDLISYYEEKKLVSSDFIGSPYSAIVDLNQIQVIDNFVSIGAWYDNEMGYSNRVLDLVQHMIMMDE